MHFNLTILNLLEICRDDSFAYADDMSFATIAVHFNGTIGQIEADESAMNRSCFWCT